MSSNQLISPAPSFLGWLLLRENLILPPADLVSEKRKRIGRIRPLQRHKPAPDHEIAIALFGQSRQGRDLPARTGTPTGRKGQSSKLGVGKVN